MAKTFYHVHVDGFTNQAKTVAEVQTWLDDIRHWVVGKELKVWRVVDCLADTDPCLVGLVSA